MARKSSSTILQEELYPQTVEAASPELDDARLVDLDVEQESPFLRGQKRVSARRGSLPPKAATRLSWIALALCVTAACGILVAAVYHYGERSWRFRIESSDNIEINGLGNVTRSQVMEVMGEDIGRNIFFVPLSERQKQLEQIPWVQSASVMRFVPNRLRIEIHERTPVAFARVGSRISLIDSDGTLMDLPGPHKKKFSFPVILGMNLGEPQSTRAAGMRIYTQLVSDLDSSGAHYSQNLSEVDVSDPDDVKVSANDPGGEVLVHLGSSNFLDRFKIYVSHVQEWRQQFSRLDSVDLRYEHQIVVNPDLRGTVSQPPLSMSTPKEAMAMGVKPAALVAHEPTPPKTLASGNSVSTKAPEKVASRVKTTKWRRRKSAWHKAAARSKVTPTPRSQHSATSASTETNNNEKPSSSAATTEVTSKASNKPSPAIPKGQPQ